MAFISGGKGNEGPKKRRTGEKRQFGRTWIIENQDFDFQEHDKSIYFGGKNGLGTSHYMRASCIY